MAIVTTDIKKYLSGGAGNTDPDAALGGAISTTEVVDDTVSNLFATCTAAESEAGSVKYRAFFVKNTHATLTYKNAVVYISANSSSTDTEVKIALADEAVGTSTIETIANKDTAPVGPVFTTADGVGNALSIGDVDPGEMKGIWVQYTVDAGASAVLDETTIAFKGETEA
jgi:hypothetical protein